MELRGSECETPAHCEFAHLLNYTLAGHMGTVHSTEPHAISPSQCGTECATPHQHHLADMSSTECSSNTTGVNTTLTDLSVCENSPMLHQHHLASKSSTDSSSGDNTNVNTTPAHFSVCENSPMLHQPHLASKSSTECSSNTTGVNTTLTDLSVCENSPMLHQHHLGSKSSTKCGSGDNTNVNTTPAHLSVCENSPMLHQHHLASKSSTDSSSGDNTNVNTTPVHLSVCKNSPMLQHFHQHHLGAMMCTICNQNVMQGAIDDPEILTKYIEQWESSKTTLFKGKQLETSKVWSFSCDLCERIFTSKNGIQSHMIRKHLKLDQFKCNECGFAHSYLNKVRKHWQIIHKGPANIFKINYPCQICTKNSYSESTLQSHVKRRHSDTLKCHLCAESGTFITAEKFKAHVLTKHGASAWENIEYSKYKQTYEIVYETEKDMKNDKYKCFICKKYSLNRSELLRHITESHYKIFSYDCRHCLYKTNKERNMRDHYLLYHPKSEHVKQIKNQIKTWNQEMKLTHQQHKLEQTNREDTVVKFEPLEYDSETQNMDSSNSCKSSENIDETSSLNDVEGHGLHFPCRICGVRTYNLGLLRVHMKTRHYILEDILITNYKCQFCGLGFRNGSEVEKHAKDKHSSELGCVECSQVFTNMFLLQNHFVSCHGVEKYKEYLIDKIYQLESTINSMKSDFSCYICHKRPTFKSKNNLKVHILGVHFDVKKLKCKLCPYKCTVIHLMRQHVGMNHPEIFGIASKNGKFVGWEPEISFQENSVETAETENPSTMVILVQPENPEYLENQVEVLQLSEMEIPEISCPRIDDIHDPKISVKQEVVEYSEKETPKNLHTMKNIVKANISGKKHVIEYSKPQSSVNNSKNTDTGNNSGKSQSLEQHSTSTKDSEVQGTDSKHPYYCTTCKIDFLVSEKLKIHLARAHSPILHCPICPNTCKSYPDLQNHFTLMHMYDNFENYFEVIKKEVYGKLFTTQLSDNKFQYTCLLCSKFYGWKTSLHAHLRYHFKMPRSPNIKDNFPPSVNSSELTKSLHENQHLPTDSADQSSEPVQTQITTKAYSNKKLRKTSETQKPQAAKTKSLYENQHLPTDSADQSSEPVQTQITRKAYGNKKLRNTSETQKPQAAKTKSLHENHQLPTDSADQSSEPAQTQITRRVYSNKKKRNTSETQEPQAKQIKKELDECEMFDDAKATEKSRRERKMKLVERNEGCVDTEAEFKFVSEVIKCEETTLETHEEWIETLPGAHFEGETSQTNSENLLCDVTVKEEMDVDLMQMTDQELEFVNANESEFSEQQMESVKVETMGYSEAQKQSVKEEIEFSDEQLEFVQEQIVFFEEQTAFVQEEIVFSEEHTEFVQEKIGLAVKKREIVEEPMVEFVEEQMECVESNVHSDVDPLLIPNSSNTFNTPIFDPRNIPVNEKSKTHESYAITYTCSKCTFKTTSISTFREHLHSNKHLSKETQDKSDLFKCKVCTNNFSSKQLLDIHVSRSHNSNLLCPTCKSETFENEDDIESHFSSVHAQESWSDYIKIIRTELNRKIMNLVSNPLTNQFQCMLCPKMFQRRAILARHVNSHFKDICEVGFSRIYTSLQTRNAPPKKKKTTYVQLPRPKLLCLDPIKENPNEDGLQKISCHICGEISQDLTKLTNHINIAHTDISVPYFCLLCDGFFTHKYNMESHWFLTHGETKPQTSRIPSLHKKVSFTKAFFSKFSCRFCNIYFYSEAELTKHESNANTHRNIYVCSMCEFASKHSEAVTSHIKVEHSSLIQNMATYQKKVACRK